MTPKEAVEALVDGNDATSGVWVVGKGDIIFISDENADDPDAEHSFRLVPVE